MSQLILADEMVRGALDNVTISQLTDNDQELTPGTLYFAIRGTRHDGHAFVGKALSAGAVRVVVEDIDLAKRLEDRAILVPSTRLAFAKAWSRWLENPSESLNVVGVTGTNGKTTTTYLLRQIWQQLGVKSGVIGTIDTWIGDEAIPSQLTTPGPRDLQGIFDQMAKAQVKTAAIEVSSIALDQERTAGTRFAAGIFTNLTQDHLDYHKSMENYFGAKLKFFTEYDLPYAIINIDDVWGKRLAESLTDGKVLTFALRNSAHFHFRSFELSKSGSRGMLVTPQGDIPFFSPLVGQHNLMNALGAIAACYSLGQDLGETVAALAKSPGAPGRLERAQVEGPASKVFVDYAHTPDALQKVLTALSDLKGASGRIITVFGCGGDRDRSKRPQMGKLVSQLSDVTIATSDNPRTENPEIILDDIEQGIEKRSGDYLREVDRRKAIHRALELAQEEDVVLVAGKGHETYQIIGEEKFPFDDRTVIRDYYSHS